MALVEHVCQKTAEVWLQSTLNAFLFVNPLALSPTFLFILYFIVQ